MYGLATRPFLKKGTRPEYQTVHTTYLMGSHMPLYLHTPKIEDFFSHPPYLFFTPLKSNFTPWNSKNLNGKDRYTRTELLESSVYVNRSLKDRYTKTDLYVYKPDDQSFFFTFSSSQTLNKNLLTWFLRDSIHWWLKIKFGTLPNGIYTHWSSKTR
jgi:hypothetical protein